MLETTLRLPAAVGVGTGVLVGLGVDVGAGAIVGVAVGVGVPECGVAVGAGVAAGAGVVVGVAVGDGEDDGDVLACSFAGVVKEDEFAAAWPPPHPDTSRAITSVKDKRMMDRMEFPISGGRLADHLLHKY